MSVYLMLQELHVRVCINVSHGVLAANVDNWQVRVGAANIAARQVYVTDVRVRVCVYAVVCVMCAPVELKIYIFICIISHSNTLAD